MNILKDIDGTEMDQIPFGEIEYLRDQYSYLRKGQTLIKRSSLHLIAVPVLFLMSGFSSQSATINTMIVLITLLGAAGIFVIYRIIIFLYYYYSFKMDLKNTAEDHHIDRHKLFFQLKKISV